MLTWTGVWYYSFANTSQYQIPFAMIISMRVVCLFIYMHCLPVCDMSHYIFNICICYFGNDIFWVMVSIASQQNRFRFPTYTSIHFVSGYNFLKLYVPVLCSKKLLPNSYHLLVGIKITFQHALEPEIFILWYHTFLKMLIACFGNIMFP